MGIEMKKEASKPRITRLRKLDGSVYYKCLDKRMEAYGPTPEDAFEMWYKYLLLKIRLRW